VTSLVPHSAHAHAQGWAAREDHDSAVIAAAPVNDARPFHPLRDRSGRFRSGEPQLPARSGVYGGALGDGTEEEGRAPPDTVRMRGGTLLPLLPLGSGLLTRERGKRVPPREDREHRGIGAWEAWRTSMWGEDEGAEGGEGRRKRRRDERKRVERMGGYGALRAWGWCEGLLEPLSEEDEPVGQEDAGFAAAEPFEPHDGVDEAAAAALKALVTEVVDSFFPSPPLSEEHSRTQGRPRSRNAAAGPATRGRGRSHTAVDPDWRPTTAARSQRSATRASCRLGVINEIEDENEVEAEAEPVSGADDERGDSTLSSLGDGPPLRESLPTVQFTEPHPQHPTPHPIHSTAGAFAPISHAWHRAPRPSPSSSSSPATSRDTSLTYDQSSPETSFAVCESPPHPSLAGKDRAARTAWTLSRSLPVPSPSSPPRQYHHQYPLHHHIQVQQPSRRAAEPEPRGPAPAVADAAPAAEEQRARLEHDAMWGLLGMNTARTTRESAVGVLEQPHVVVFGRGVAARGGGMTKAREWEPEEWSA
ncbi:hypothetical protein DMC30DRAFT_105662, partial [Rhodotorula diobovata]